MSEIEDFERSTRRKRNIRLGILALVISSPFLWLGYTCRKQEQQNAEYREEARKANELTPAQRAELDKLIPELRTRIQRASQAFAADMTPAKLAAIAPGDAPCPSFNAASDPVITKPGAPIEPTELKGLARSLESLAQSIHDADEPTKYHLEEAHRLSYELEQQLVFVGERDEPVVLADSYVPGRVRGTAYVYSQAAHRVVCAGDIDVENAPEVKIEYTTSTYDVTGSSSKRAAATTELARDLWARTRKAIVASLHTVR